MTVALFTAFLAVSLAKAFGGAAGCGCFGKLSVNPWWAAAIDTVVLAALLKRSAAVWVSRPRPRVAWRRTLGISGLVAASTAIAMCYVWASTNASDDGIRLYRDGRVALLLPDRWVGKICPLLRHIDGGGQLAQGRWRLILFHHNCLACRALLAGRGADDSLRGDNRRIAWMELPPLNSGEITVAAADVHCRLSAAREWIVDTPTQLLLDDGKVINASVGPQMGGGS